MKKFLIKTLFFSLLLVAIDRCFILLKYNNERNIFVEIGFAKLSKLAAYINDNKINSVDIAVFGSSHPQFGVSPEIIYKNTGKSCLNFAYGAGTNISAQFNFIKKLKIKTKTIVYAIDVFSLNQEAVTTDVFQDSFFSKYSNYQKIDKIGKTAYLMGQAYAYIKNTDFMTYSNMYLYSHFAPKYLNDIAHQNYKLPYFRSNNLIDTSMFCRYNGYNITQLGWVQGNGLANLKFIRYNNMNFEPKMDSKAALTNIIKYCKENNIQLILIQIPEHAASLRYSQKYMDFDKWMSEFVAETKVNYINYNKPDVFPVNNDSLFFDTDHLNIAGAELFSTQLSKSLKDLGLQ